MNNQVNFKILWKVLPKVSIFMAISTFYFVLLNFFLGLFGVFIFQEPIQKIIFYSIFIGAFITHTVKEYNEAVRQATMSKRKVTVNISWDREHRRYNVSIPELNASTFGEDIPEAFRKAEDLIQKLTNK